MRGRWGCGEGKAEASFVDAVLSSGRLEDSMAWKQMDVGRHGRIGLWRRLHSGWIQCFLDPFPENICGIRIFGCRYVFHDRFTGCGDRDMEAGFHPMLEFQAVFPEPLPWGLSKLVVPADLIIADG